MVEWESSMIAATCVIFVLSALTMPAGIGGGILFVPVLRLIGSMSQKDSSALSQVLITGAAVGSIIFQVIWQLRHKSEPLLAQPFFVTLMLPALLSGSLFGVYLSRLLPEFICLIVLVCLCVLSSVMIFRKGVQTFRKENLIFATRIESRSASPPVGEAMLPPPPLNLTDADRGISLISLEVGINIPPEVGMYETIEAPPQSFLFDETIMITPANSVVSIASMRKRERSRRMSSMNIADESTEIDHTLEDQTIVRDSKIMRFITQSIRSFAGFVFVYWIFLIVFTLLRGSRSNPSFTGIKPCGEEYWILTGLQAGIGLCLSVIIGYKEALLIFETFLTGVLATVSGASGGIILNPILLSKGLDPQQTSATSTIIMFVMASCSALEFIIEGTVPTSDTYLMLITFGGSVLGMTLVTWLIKILGRQSILVFLLGGLVVVGGGMLMYIGASDVVNEYRTGKDPFEFGTLC